MKAQTFLRFYLQVGEDRIGKVAEFYSQPFHPDMIVDLFTNIEKTGNIYLIGKQDWVDMYPNKKLYSLMSKINFPFGTLDQFIGDCQRFNVELIWKKEISEKYTLSEYRKSN